MTKFAVTALISLVACAAASAGEPPVPTGRLSDTVRPTAYRIQLTVDPAAKDYSGHTEIDATLKAPTRVIFLHGNGLKVSKAVVTAGQKTLVAQYKEVDESGVARLDLPGDVAPGKVTLSFDYTTGFRTGAEGLFHVKVGDDWYAWTQMEPIDARRVFPGFDEPGFKTPFTVTVTAPSSSKVFSNTPETGTTSNGSMTTHRFATTQALPTYLVAIGVGPFDVVDTTVPPNAVRSKPLALRVIATKGQSPRMQIAAVESPKLLALIEQYLGIPYPFEKLDLLSSPNMGGAMENAGLIIQDDTLMLLDKDAPLEQLRLFSEVTAHEMAHQWFGDLVSPAWWTDIWLNESFAEWMGKKASDQWRPDLGIAASELSDAFRAMDTDSLGSGRPIRQKITQNRQIASAFDEITYQKGAQVLSMFESYLGHDKFARGVHLHLTRYRGGNATADNFFDSLGTAANDPKIIAAMRTFTDQTGVPIVSVSGDAHEYKLSQSRYRPLGVHAVPPQTWIIPLCFSAGSASSCRLMDSATASVPALSSPNPVLPNANGAGYYRFRLDDQGWNRLIESAGTLPTREALAVADSVWSDFAAGTGRFDRVLAAARSLSLHPERLAATELALRLRTLALSALTTEQLPKYRQAMESIYGPRLSALGFDPTRDAHKKDSVARQSLRTSLVAYVALEARDPALRAQLTRAAESYLAGDKTALDSEFRGTAFSVAAQEHGAPFMAKLHDALVKSSDPLFREHASDALGSADTPALAKTAVDYALSPGVQPIETMLIVLRLSNQPGVRPTLLQLIDKDFKKMMEAFPGFAKPSVISVLNNFCAPGDAQMVDAFMRPKLKSLGGGELELEHAKERIGRCIALKAELSKQRAF